MGGATTTKEIKQMDTINETGENNEDEIAAGAAAELSDEDEEIEMFVESKYCTVCHLE